MYQPKKWWIGLIPVAVVFLIAMWRTSSPVEADLVSRANEELKRSGLDWAKTALVGRDAVVEGVAPEAGMQEMATTAAERAWGVRQVADRTTVLPEQKPFVVTAVREGSKITLTGAVRSDAARAAGVAAAKAAFPNAEVIDQRVLARGATAGYAAGLAHGIAQLGRLSGGTAVLSDDALSVVGAAADFPGFDAVTGALKALPAGVSLAKAEITPPRISPFDLNAVKTAAGVTLTGVIPAEAARAPIVAAARTAVGSGAVTDNLRVASGAPAGVDFAQAGAFAAAQLARFTTGEAKLSNTALTVTGAAADFPGFDAANAALRALPAGVSLASANIAPPVVSPFELTAAKTAAGVTLAGVIPAEAARAPIVAAARTAAGSGAVTDNLRVASGAPAGVDFGQAGAFALGQLARLTTGSIVISNDQLTIAGVAATVPVYEAVNGALGAAALPGGVKLASRAITGPTQSPYTWGAARDAAALTLSGFAPSEAVRAGIIDAAKGLFPNVDIVDRMQLALGAPAGFAEAARAGLAQLARLATGSAAISNTALTVAGEALQSDAASAVRGALGSGLPQGFRGVANVTVRPPPPPPPAPAPQASIIVPSLPPVVLSPLAQECQDKFNQMLAKEQIRFASGRADIQEESNELIRALAEEAKRCPATRLDVQGHTDSDGSAEMNQSLSERRAAAVANRLFDFGVERHRVFPAGFGPTRPLAPNDTAENKAKNRRIEFVVSE